MPSIPTVASRTSGMGFSVWPSTKIELGSKMMSRALLLSAGFIEEPLVLSISIERRDVKPCASRPSFCLCFSKRLRDDDGIEIPRRRGGGRIAVDQFVEADHLGRGLDVALAAQDLPSRDIDGREGVGRGFTVQA